MYMSPFNLRSIPLYSVYQKICSNVTIRSYRLIVAYLRLQTLLLLLQVSIAHSDECLWLALGEPKAINSCAALDPWQSDVSGVCYRSC